MTSLVPFSPGYTVLGPLIWQLSVVQLSTINAILSFVVALFYLLIIHKDPNGDFFVIAFVE